MTDEEYTDLTTRVRALAEISMQFEVEELEEALRAIDHSNTVGPILSPTAWGAGHKRMDAMADVIKAMVRLRTAAAAFQRVVEDTEPHAKRVREDAAAILGIGP